MAERTPGFGGEEIKEESSWRYPLGIALATLMLSAIFLFYYLGPRLEDISGDAPKPTISDELVSVTIDGVRVAVPANYTIYPRARRGGARDTLALYALWPNMSPYSPARRRDFTENAPNTRRINIDIVENYTPYTERQKFDRIYLPLLIDPEGEAADYGLTKYAFKDSRPDTPQNAYKDEELFAGRDESGQLILLRCFKDVASIPSPHCRRDYLLPNGLAASYRFKRAHLAQWRDIDAKSRNFIAGLFDPL